MNLKQLIQEIDEKKLGKPELEQYYSKLSFLSAQLYLELADLEKNQAIFMHDKNKEQKVNDRELEWGVTPNGQRLIEVKNYIRATNKMLSSLKNRIYEYI